MVALGISSKLIFIDPICSRGSYEVAQAIRSDNPDELKEELGDLLLQIILHAQIAKEKNLFDMTDIIDISLKN